jgi:hypothetical protein
MKCFICESTDHLRADCPDRLKPAGGEKAKENEQIRKPRGNVATLRDDSASSTSERADDDVEAVTAELDAMTIDAGIEVEVSEAISGDEGTVADAEEGEPDEPATDTSGDWWYFDTTANVHVTTYYSSFPEDVTQSQSVRGVTPALATRIAEVGTVCLVTQVNDEPTE